MNREKIIKDLEFCVNGRFKVELSLATKILELLKEQEEEIENLKQTCQSMMEGVCLLKEQEAITIKKTKEPYGYGVYGGICPKCRNWIQSAHSFCGFCGQAVKWE